MDIAAKIAEEAQGLRHPAAALQIRGYARKRLPVLGCGARDLLPAIPFRTGCKGVLFFKLPASSRGGGLDPLHLTNCVHESVLKGDGKHATRFISRLLPCQVICKGDVESIGQAVVEQATKVVAASARRPPKTFAIQVKRRQNTTIDRDAAIAAAAEGMAKAVKGIRVDLTRPDLCVLLEVVRSMCCVCILDEWLRFNKYSLRREAPVGAPVADPCREGSSAVEGPPGGSDAGPAAPGTDARG